RLEDFRGQWVVLYFYPKDNTPGCTVEAQEFSTLKDQFSALNAVVLGMSPDSVSSHQKFTGKHGLEVNLLSDPEHQILEQFGAWRLKKNYGKEYMGVRRSTFLIDPSGVIRHTWAEVKAAGHAAEVLATLRNLV
ncbi:MAG: peroxiredoxin, partial [Desulfovibrionales bacterium]|nr:peroxiredoxin [Desulfovibrionales bacterium]